MLTISIVCPIYNESNYISFCIESIINQDYPLDKIEVLFVDGMSTDTTREIVNDFSMKYSFIKLIDNPLRIVSQALNIGIKASSGEIIVRMDAHCIYPNNYLSLLVYYLIELKADNVGGMILTLPANSTNIANAISTVMSHPFGVGNSLFRIGCKKIKKVDTVPFGCFHRGIFDRIGFFDPDLIRNQDDEFCARIIKSGGKIYLIPDIIIKYFARDNIKKLWLMFYQYGLYKPLVTKKIGFPSTARQFFPLLFVLGIIGGIGISSFNDPAFLVTALILILYFLLSITVSSFEALSQKKTYLLFILPFLFIVLHVSYGWGYLMGIVKFFLLNKTKKV